MYFVSGFRMYEYIKEMWEQVFDKYDCMIVGELGFIKIEESVVSYVVWDRYELNMFFMGDIVDMDFGQNYKYEWDDFCLFKFKNIINLW